MENRNPSFETNQNQSSINGIGINHDIPPIISTTNDTTLAINGSTIQSSIQQPQGVLYSRTIENTLFNKEITTTGNARSNQTDLEPIHDKCPVCNKTGHTQRTCSLSICAQCRKRGHIRKDCPLFTYMKCGKQGHAQANCPGRCSACNSYRCYRKKCQVNIQLAKVRRYQNCRRIECKDINCQRP